jgi:large subunit ribosomal protein L10
MPLTKTQKKKIIDSLKESIKKQKIVFFVDLKGVKVKELFDLRKRLKKTNSQLKVAKKTLLRKAFEENKIKIDTKKLEGEVAAVFGLEDEISPAKTAYQFSLGNKNLKILGGYFEGGFKGAEEIITLAQLPTKEEILSRLVGSIRSPVANIISVLQGNIKGLVHVLSEIKK